VVNTCEPWVYVKIESQPARHGHCFVEHKPGDGEIEGALANLKTDDNYPLLDMCKLGQFCWTGGWLSSTKQPSNKPRGSSVPRARLARWKIKDLRAVTSDMSLDLRR
jgi:hypothetical protein